LSGKTLYIVAMIPDPLFSTTPSFALGADKHSGTLSLSGVYPPVGVATYTNNITVLACLDSGCTNQLAGSGFKVPYVVNVRSGLKSATTALNTSFGSFPAPVSVPIQMPAGSTWRVTGVDRGNPLLIAGSTAPDGSTNLIVTTPELSLPGTTNDGNLILEAVTPDGHLLRNAVHVTSTTTPSAVPVAIKQQPFTASIPHGNVLTTFDSGVTLLTPGGDAGKIHFLDITYASPAAASSNTFKDHWVFLSSGTVLTSNVGTAYGYHTGYHIQGCNGGTSCLPVGTYTATLRFQYSPLGSTPTILSYVITMDITP